MSIVQNVYKLTSKRSGNAWMGAQKTLILYV